MNEYILGMIIAVLVGCIIGGSSGAAIIRRTLKIQSNDTDSPNKTYNSANIAAVAASTAAASTAASFRTELNEHMQKFESRLEANTEKLASLNNTIAGFTSACLERHKAIDRRLEIIEVKSPGK